MCDCVCVCVQKCGACQLSFFTFLLMFRLLAPGQVAKSENVYSYKYIVDCMEQNQLLDISEYRSVSVVVL